MCPNVCANVQQLNWITGNGTPVTNAGSLSSKAVGQLYVSTANGFNALSLCVESGASGDCCLSNNSPQEAQSATNQELNRLVGIWQGAMRSYTGTEPGPFGGTINNPNGTGLPPCVNNKGCLQTPSTLSGSGYNTGKPNYTHLPPVTMYGIAVVTAEESGNNTYSYGCMLTSQDQYKQIKKGGLSGNTTTVEVLGGTYPHCQGSHPNDPGYINHALYNQYYVPQPSAAVIKTTPLNIGFAKGTTPLCRYTTIPDAQLVSTVSISSTYIHVSGGSVHDYNPVQTYNGGYANAQGYNKITTNKMHLQDCVIVPINQSGNGNVNQICIYPKIGAYVYLQYVWENQVTSNCSQNTLNFYKSDG